MELNLEEALEAPVAVSYRLEVPMGRLERPELQDVEAGDGPEAPEAPGKAGIIEERKLAGGKVGELAGQGAGPLAFEEVELDLPGGQGVHLLVQNVERFELTVVVEEASQDVGGGVHALGNLPLRAFSQPGP